MRALSNHDLLQIWEDGANRHNLDRALLILRVGEPEKTWHELAELTIGERDRRLLVARELTFGPQVVGLTYCPKCEEKIEFGLDMNEIVMPARSDSGQSNEWASPEGWTISFRLPNSYDLAAIVNSGDTESAYRILLQRCITNALFNGTMTTIDELPDSVAAVLSDEMAKRDPQADLSLDLQCPNCDHTWSLAFDIVSFFWQEIQMRIKRLLRQIHLLASAYGWCESDILAMSEVRKQFYLEMLGE